MNLAAVIDVHPADRPAIVSRGKTTSYGELRRQVAEMRGSLLDRGIVPGDRVAILAANNWYFVSTYLAVLGVGALAVPLNPGSPAPEVQRELDVVGASLAVAGPTGRTAIAGVDIDAVPSLTGVVAAHDLLGGESAGLVDRADGDLAVLLFTSGTAGAPRAAMLTHGNLRANVGQIRAGAGPALGGAQVALGTLPLYHVFGLNAVLGLALETGGTVVLAERFDPYSTLEAIAEHGITVVSGVPSMWSALAAVPGVEPSAVGSVRLAVSGASPLDPSVRRLVEDRLGLTLHDGYGLTEAAPVVASAVGADAPAGSVGRPLPGVEVRLVDADGADVLVGDPGEIWVRGPNVFAGYWRDAEATQATLTPEGWLRTGDVAVVDDEGFLYLVDRVKDVIIVSGFNVYPGEVEEVIAEHPAVEAAAVVGVPHPHSGEAVRAFVVPVAGASLEEEAIVEFCARRLARYKLPSTVAFVDELPRGMAGKLLRRALRQGSPARRL